MVNGIRTISLDGLNKGFTFSFSVASQVQHKTPEEGWRTYRLKCCEYNNKDDYNPNILSDKNQVFLWNTNDFQTDLFYQ